MVPLRSVLLSLPVHGSNIGSVATRVFMQTRVIVFLQVQVLRLQTAVMVDLQMNHLDLLLRLLPVLQRTCRSESADRLISL